MNNQYSIYHLAVAGVQGLVPYQPGKPISELERDLGIDNIVKLASNENPLGPSDQVLDALQAALPELARYPDGSGFALKNALADKLAVETGQITLGNGSNELLRDRGPPGAGPVPAPGSGPAPRARRSPRRAPRG